MTSTPNRRGPRKGTGTTRVYEHLRSQILSLELSPGENLSEPSIVNEMGVSRTPVREAIVRLASEGLVEMLPNQGARVGSMDMASVSETLEALELCQRAVTRWAAVNRSEQQLEAITEQHETFKNAAADFDFNALVESNRAFHSAIGDACGNTIIAGLYDSLLNKSLRMARIILGRRFPDIAPDHRYDVVITEHEAILQSLKDQDAEEADRLGAQHADLFRRSVITFVSQNRAMDMIVSNPKPSVVEAVESDN